MSASISIVGLARDIAKSAETLDQFLQSEGLTLSFDENAMARFPGNAPEDAWEARSKIIEATGLLRDLVMGPAEHLKWQVSLAQDLVPIQWIEHFKIADHVPLNGMIKYDDLAAKAKVDARILRRILRTAMLTHHLFNEPQPDVICHSATSRLLATDPDIQGIVHLEMTLLLPALSKTAEAHQKFGFSTKPDETAWKVAFGDSHESIYDWFTDHPEKAELLTRMMREFTRTEGWSSEHLLHSYDWTSLGTAKIVDVGGNTGSVSIELARAYPDLTIIVQDMPDTVARGRLGLPEDLKGRIEFQEHDFFTPQPVKDADIFFFQNVFTDHSHESAVKILQKIVPSMKEGARIVLREAVVPLPGEWSSTVDELRLRRFDLRAMAIENSGHRYLDEWKALLFEAHCELEIIQVNRPPRSLYTLLAVQMKN